MKKLTYCLALVLIASNMNAAIFTGRNVKPTCGIKVVSYKFVGNVGTELVYGSKSFTIPQTGVIELVAQKNQTTVQVAGKSLELQSNATDEFGTATVELSRTATL